MYVVKEAYIDLGLHLLIRSKRILHDLVPQRTAEVQIVAWLVVNSNVGGANVDCEEVSECKTLMLQLTYWEGWQELRLEHWRTPVAFARKCTSMSLCRDEPAGRW